MSRRRSTLIASFACLLAAGGLLYAMRGSLQRDITGTATAIDGDSLKIGDEEMRLKGLDALELEQICKVSGQDIPCGRNARAALRRLLSSGLVTCVGDERDRYGRLLVYCRVRGLDINAQMVRDGHAVSFGDYVIEEAQAKAAYRGVWAGEFERPRDWRARHRQP